MQRLGRTRERRLGRGGAARRPTQHEDASAVAPSSNGKTRDCAPLSKRQPGRPCVLGWRQRQLSAHCVHVHAPSVSVFSAGATARPKTSFRGAVASSMRNLPAAPQCGEAHARHRRSEGGRVSRIDETEAASNGASATQDRLLRPAGRIAARRALRSPSPLWAHAATAATTATHTGCSRRIRRRPARRA